MRKITVLTRNTGCMIIDLPFVGSAVLDLHEEIITEIPVTVLDLLQEGQEVILHPIPEDHIAHRRLPWPEKRTTDIVYLKIDDNMIVTASGLVITSEVIDCISVGEKVHNLGDYPVCHYMNELLHFLLDERLEAA